MRYIGLHVAWGSGTVKGMTTPSPTPMNGYADQPVTQAEFTDAMGAIKQDLDQMATKADLAKLRGQIASMKDEIIRHFNVVAENIHHDVAAANADRVSLLEDQREEHETRLTTVEQHLGIRP